MKLRFSLAGVLVVIVCGGLTAACGTTGTVNANASWTSSSSASPSTSPAAASLQAHPADPTIHASPTAQNDEATREGLTIQVIGTCASNNNQGMTLKATGFTPNGRYLTQAWYPGGQQQYTYLLNGGQGTANAQGQLPNWTWNCFTAPANANPDPAGTYTLRVTDLSTGAWVRTTFSISYTQLSKLPDQRR